MHTRTGARKAAQPNSLQPFLRAHSHVMTLSFLLSGLFGLQYTYLQPPESETVKNIKKYPNMREYNEETIF